MKIINPNSIFNFFVTSKKPSIEWLELLDEERIFVEEPSYPK
jgi:hypothetical protein